MLAALAAIVCNAVAATPVVELSADELEKLAAREVIIRQEPTDQGTFTIGVLDVNAEAAKVLDAVLDFEARVGEVGGIRAVSRYLDEGNRVGARWDLSVVGKAVSFTTLYDIDRTNLIASYRMDTTQQNDLKHVEGAYAVVANGTSSRLYYRSLTDSGVYVPGWLKSWLANSSLVEVLEGIRTRAEK